ncbi:inositol monophosphatase family protein [Kiloniella laminariae]|uniref:inositol monophosphatase family protein n=1 Tax=Kiloniella laminariae TaxID=454162 RepID=UPI0003726602|nr:inositol monophosphatase [Kiloniella laminariae]
MFIKLDQIPSFLKDVAETEIMPRFRNLAQGEVLQKKGGETVTIADLEAEKHLSRLLLNLFPGSYVIGEEKAAEQPGLLNNLPDEKLVWVIDPIDGTNNFARGSETFRTMLALLYQGETIAAWIYDPVRNVLLEAQKGEGARLDGQALVLSIPFPLQSSDCIGTLHGSENSDPVLAKTVERNRNQLNVVRTLRCAGADYERLSCSETHFALFTRLMPWDHLPGILIHQEAGGYSACLDGEAYRADSYAKEGLLLAPNRQIWTEIRDVLVPAVPGK